MEGTTRIPEVRIPLLLSCLTFLHLILRLDRGQLQIEGFGRLLKSPKTEEKKEQFGGIAFHTSGRVLFTRYEGIMPSGC